MDRKVSGVACAALAIAAMLAPPVAAAGKDDGNGNGPPAHAPAHGVHGTQPGHVDKQEAAPEQAAPAPAAAPKAPKAERKAAKRAAKSERKAAKSERKAAKRTAKAQRPSQTPPAGRPGSAPGQQRKADRPKDKDAKSKRTASGDKPGGGQPKTTFCHATGSEKNPYVVITTANPAVVNAHSRHLDGADIIPAPAGGCPQAAAPVEGSREALGAPRSVTADSVDAPAPVAVPAQAPAAPAAPTGTIRRVAIGVGSSIIRVIEGERIVVPDVERQGILGDAATVDDRDVLGQTADTRPRDTAEVTPATAADDGGLPFTGLQALLLALIGAGALLAGVALHRASRQPGRR